MIATRRFAPKLAMLVAGALLASLWSAGPSHRAEADASPYVETAISPFEADDEGWTFSDGPEFPGAQGSFALQADDVYAGEHAGKLIGDFAAGGNYVSIGKTLPSVEMERLRLRAKTADASAVTLRLLDSTGQIHQQRLSLQPSTAWQTVDIASLDDGPNAAHWGGANDGVWHGPARGVYLILDKHFLQSGKTAGAVLFDDLTALVPPPPLAVKQRARGNIFDENENASFFVEGAPGSRLAWTVADFWGRTAATGERTLQGASETLALPPLPTGYYELRAETLSGETSLGAAKTTFAIVPGEEVADRDSIFAVATHFGQRWDPELMPLIAKAGFTSIRDEMDWGAAEPRKGEYDFSGKFANYEAAARANGLEPFLLLSYTNPHYDNNSTPYTDEGRQGFANYGAAALTEFPETKRIEVYNEFNIGFGDRGDGPADSKPEYYVELLKETYEKLKATDPNVTVVGMATANMPWAWIEEVFRLGGLDYMDAASVHPYRYPQPPEGMTADLVRLDALIRQYNGGEPKPIWSSELGWPTQNDPRGVSEATQASYAVRSNVLSLAAGVEKVYWYDFKNDGIDPAYNEHNFGLVRNEADPLGAYVPKPAYSAYAYMTRALDGATFVRRDDAGSGSVHSYLFEDDGEPVRVLWSTAPRLLALKTEGLTATDAMGAATTALTPDKYGNVYVSAGEEPIYLRGDVAAIEESAKLKLTTDGVVPGESATVTLTIDNTRRQDNRFKGSFEVNGVSAPVDVKPGDAGAVSVTLPPMGAGQTAFATVSLHGKPVARMSVSIPAIEPIAYNIRHALTPAGDAVRITATNRRSQPYRLTAVDWQMNGQAGTDVRGLTVPANGTGSLDIPIVGATPGAPAPYSLTLRAEGAAPYAFAGKLTPIDAAALPGIASGGFAIDGVVDAAAGAPLVRLPADGAVVIDGYGGEADLSGDIRLRWDEENVYVSANITDDIFSQPNAEGSIWMGDSVQIALSQGAKGESPRWYELGMALTPNGPELYRWSGSLGQPAAPLAGVPLAIERDEAAKTTVYELALPWSVLAPLSAEDGMLAASLLVNDDDGAGRKGFIEWGGGIGGAKDNNLFHTIRLLP